MQRNHLVTPNVVAGLEALGDGEFDDTAPLAELIKGPIAGSFVADKGSVRNARTRAEKTGVRNDVELLLRQIGFSAIAITFRERVYDRSVMTLGPRCESSGDGRSGLDLECVFIRLSTLMADHIAGSIVSEIDKAIVCSCWNFVHATGLAIWMIAGAVAFAPSNFQLDDIFFSFAINNQKRVCLRLAISLQLLHITMRCDVRDKGESEEQNCFGSHCEEKNNIYSVRVKAFNQ